MSASSEEEILKRRRTNKLSSKKKDLRNLFDEDSSVSSIEYIPESTVQDNFFCELFGTGKEYFYIFDTHKIEEDKEEEIIKNKDLVNITKYVQKHSNDENILKICELYLKGYNIYYIFLYETSNLDFYEYLDILKNITGSSYNNNIINLFFDRIFNGSINLKKDDKIFSITKEKNMIKGVILDWYGNILEKFSFLDNKILSYVEENNPKYIFISGYNNMVRNVVQLLIKYKIYYMECKYFNKMSVYDRLCHVGRLGIFPEVEFINFYKNLYLVGDYSYNNVIYKEDKNNEEFSDNIKLAISLVLSVTKLNLEFLLQYENKLKILEFLGLGNCTRIFENDKYENKEDIKKIIKDDVLFKNFMTYFKINLNKTDNNTIESDKNINGLNNNINGLNNNTNESDNNINKTNNNTFKLDKNTFKLDKNTIESDKNTIESDQNINGLNNNIINSDNIKYGRPSFRGFPDSFVFRELINIKINCIQDLLNKEIEGKIFYVDEYYVLVNILNNVTCYVRCTEKYYLNQIVKLKILEINEPFLSFTGEIVSNNKILQKIIKHPLLVNLNDKDAQNKLKNSEEYFLIRQSTKDNKIIILLKLYKDIILHIKLEDYNNLDESVNKKVKNILRLVSIIKRHKYFYEDEDKAMLKISEYCEYIKYGFFFSKEYPGKLCFIYNSRGISKEYLSIDEKILYKGKEYENLEEFIEYRKRQ